jgi:hypothetical protein
MQIFSCQCEVIDLQTYCKCMQNCVLLLFINIIFIKLLVVIVNIHGTIVIFLIEKQYYESNKNIMEEVIVASFLQHLREISVQHIVYKLIILQLREISFYTHTPIVGFQ